MELSIFMKELESALIKRGIPAELAHNHVASIRRTFTSDDLSEIASIKSESAINDLADSISNVLKKKKGFIAAFSSKSTRTEVLLKHLQENEDFKSLSEYEELICIAINL